MSDGRTTGDPTVGDDKARWRQADGLLSRRAGSAELALAARAPVANGGNDHSGPVLLSGTALVLWDLLRDPITVEALAAEVAQLYAADPETVRRDVSEAVEAFSSHGILDRAD